MLIYEVSLKVVADIEKEYTAWLDAHIQEIVTLPQVESAVWYAEVESDGIRYVVHYQMKTKQSYHEYIEKHAPRLRQEAINRFGDQFQATRRLLSSIRTYSAH